MLPVTDKVYKVAELTQLLKLTLETQFASIQVLGEASGVVLASSGHLYFTLKDGAGAMKVAMFRGSLQRSTLKQLENGQQIVVRGTLSVYPLRGELQIIASDMRLQGIGDIFAALEKLKKAYQEKGYFDPQRKKPLPLLPGRIGVVTSPTGAAVRDIVRILRRRFPGIAVVIYPAKVQGEGSAAEIAAGIDYFNAAAPAQAVDVLIVGRGGGSYEDLWAFNEGPVVEAIFRSRLPVISAVGHETDFTIADFVADLRAATPSAAAELVVGKKDEFLNRIDYLRHALMRQMERGLHEKRSSLQQLRGESALADFPGRLQELAQRLDNGEFALSRLFQQLPEAQAGRVESLPAALRCLRPGRPADEPGAAGAKPGRTARGALRRAAPAAAGTAAAAGHAPGRHEPRRHPGPGLFHYHRPAGAGGARRGGAGRRRQDPHPLRPRHDGGQGDQGVNHEERDA